MYNIKNKLWVWNGKGAWFFITIEKDIADKIKKSFPKRAPGFGQKKVSVTIGKTTWETSIFPDKRGVYLLPIKAAVRKAEKLREGEMISVKFKVIDKPL